MNTVCILIDNEFTNDMRVQRAAVALKDQGWAVTVCAIQTENLPVFDVVADLNVERIIPPEVLNIKNISKKKCFVKQIATRNFSVIHCNDHTMLDLGVRIKKINKKTVLIYDAHELLKYWPTFFPPKTPLINIIKTRIIRRFEIYKELRNIKKADYVITVNQSLKNIFWKEYKVVREPVVIRNVSAFETSNEKSNILREIFHIPADHLITVFLGWNLDAKTRNLYAVIDEFKNRDKIHLVFISRDGKSKEELREFIRKNHINNIYFHGYIADNEIYKYLSSADVGLVSTWNKRYLSHWFALDNKIFDYIRAGIPIIATRQPEYENIVEKHQIGVCVNPDIENAYIDGLYKLLNNYDFYKNNIIEVSKKITWQKEQTVLIEMYNQLFFKKMGKEKKSNYFEQWKGRVSPLHAYNDAEWIKKYNEEILFYLKGNKNIIEGGCGNGDFITNNYGLFDSYLGVDFSETMIRHAIDKIKNNPDVKNVEFKTGNILEIDKYSEKQYDVFFSNSLIQYLNYNEMITLFNKSYYIIKEDGFVLHLNVPNKSMRNHYLMNLHKSLISYSALSLCFNYLRTHFYVIKKNLFGKFDDSIGNWYTKEEIIRAAEITNFSVEFFYSIYPPYSYRYHIKLTKKKNDS